MGSIAFVGRILFASVFLIAICKEISEFGTDGGPAAKVLGPKYNTFTKNVKAKLVPSEAPYELSAYDVKKLLAVLIGLKILGSLLFISGDTLGAKFMALHHVFATPILYDFYNYNSADKEYNQLFFNFTQNLAFIGALFFYIGMNNSIPKNVNKRSPKTIRLVRKA